MKMNELSKKLCSMYQEHEEQMQTFAKKCIETKRNEEISFPWQLSSATDKYCSAKVKIMVVGQETNGWGDIDDIAENMLATEEFQTHNSYSGVPFFQFVKDLAEALNGKSDSYIDTVFYTNLFKIANNDRPKYLVEHKNLATEYCNNFNTLLEKEIEILNPKLLVFTTGPYYDEWIKTQFEGVEYSTVTNADISQFARLSHKALPQNTFRTYHPGFMNRDRESRWYPIIEKLKEICNQNC